LVIPCSYQSVEKAAAVFWALNPRRIPLFSSLPALRQ
jgi:hypothetical protein